MPVDNRLDSDGDFRWVLVLPVPQDRPATRREFAIRTPIPGNIAVQLARPPVSIRFRPRRMIWTAVPVAAVDEHNDSKTPPHNVAAYPEVFLWSNVDTVSNTRGVEPLPNLELGIGITATL